MHLLLLEALLDLKYHSDEPVVSYFYLKPFHHIATILQHQINAILSHTFMEGSGNPHVLLQPLLDEPGLFSPIKNIASNYFNNHNDDKHRVDVAIISSNCRKRQPKNKFVKL